MKVIANNKKAFHDYFIEDKFEAGLVLNGTEIKSIRLGKVNLKDSFCYIKDNEIFVNNMHISKYEQGNRFNHEPTRRRKLLLNSYEILKLEQKKMREGYTIVPLRLYLINGFAKLEVGLAKGKKNHDKRNTEKDRDAKRQIERAFKDNQR